MSNIAAFALMVACVDVIFILAAYLAIYEIGKARGYRDAWSVIIEQLACSHAELTVRKYEKKD